MPEYEFTTMYEPRSGTPVSVPAGEVQARLNEGFRTQQPDENTVLKPTLGMERVDVSPSADIAAREMIAIEINTGTLKDLSTRLGLSTPQAKLVKERRPFENLEDLIAKIPEVNNWANMAHLISFTEKEPPSEKEEEEKSGVDSEAEVPDINVATTNESITPSGTSKATPKKSS